MADTFLDSFSTGLNFAHQMENNKRLQQQQQMQMQQQQMQMMKLAAELQGVAQGQQQEQEMRQAFTPRQTPSTFQQAPTPDPMGLTQNQPQSLVPGGRSESPEMESLLSMYPRESHPMVQKLAQMGMWDRLKEIPKVPIKDEKEVNVANDLETFLSRRYPGFYTDKSIRAKALQDYGTNPKLAKEFDAHLIKMAQAKAPPIYNVLPGYQSPEGKPVPFNVRSGSMPSELQKTPSESDVSAARTKETITAIIDEIDSAFDRAGKSLPRNATERVSGYATRLAKLKTQTDPNLVLADSLSQGFLAKFARAAGEVGVLTDQDIERARKLAVNIHDTPEVRKGKLSGIKNLFNEIYERGKRQQSPLGGGKGKPSLDQIFKGQ